MSQHRNPFEALVDTLIDLFARITLRYGKAQRIAPRATPAEVAALAARIEREARALSEPLSPTPATSPATVAPLRVR
jgi:hypothetical protein